MNKRKTINLALNWKAQILLGDCCMVDGDCCCCCICGTERPFQQPLSVGTKIVWTQLFCGSSRVYFLTTSSDAAGAAAVRPIGNFESCRTSGKSNRGTWRCRCDGRRRRHRCHWIRSGGERWPAAGNYKKH